MKHKHYYAYRSFQPEFATMERFAAIDVNTIALFPANTSNSLGQPYCRYPANRLWFDTWDFTVVGRQFDDVLEHNPRANFIVIVDLNSPEWLSRQLALSHESGDSTTHLSETLVNPRWLCDTEHYLEAFLSYCEKNYAEKIEAYVLACGNTDEWFDHNGELCGLAKERAYQEYRARNGLPPETPPSAGKLNSPDFDGLVFDPARSDDVITYRRFCNELVAESILRFARFSRKVIRPKAEIGVFYGYLTTRLGAAESGHVELRRVLDAPEVDFLISPGCYIDRAIGGGSGWQSVSGSERLAGKRHLHECDQRTHTYNPSLSPHVKLKFQCWKNTAEDIAGVRREAVLAMISDSSLWWFDMWGGFYEESALLEELGRLQKLYCRFAGQPGTPVDEIALIIDADSAYYLDQRSPRQAHFQRHARTMLNHVGAPFDTYLLDDLGRIPDFDRYKLVILANQIEITPEKAELLERYLYCGNRTVLTLYAPGLSDGTSLDPARVRRWAGVEYGSEGLHLTEFATCRKAYLAHPEKLTAAILRDLARQAGVLLITSREAVVYADSRMLALHLAEPGTITITLPGGADGAVELFSGRRMHGGVFEWNSRGGETLLFELKFNSDKKGI
ncbi:hypothetical protein [Victivallis sp.]|uniref:hypothetical protein n=1 Tax=Victivallis sp. TaxID=2049020 RepID=UPI003A8F45C1